MKQGHLIKQIGIMELGPQLEQLHGWPEHRWKGLMCSYLHEFSATQAFWEFAENRSNCGSSGARFETIDALKLAAESITACVLVPPTPNKLTLARSNRPCGQGVGSLGTVSFADKGYGRVGTQALNIGRNSAVFKSENCFYHL